MEKGLHSYHASEISEWKRCRRAHKWKYRDMLYDPTPAMPLELGTALHAMMAEYYDPKKWRKRKGADRFSQALDEFVRINDEQRKRTFEFRGDPFNADSINDDYDERYQVAMSMLEYWDEHDADEFHQRLYPCATEKLLEFTFDDGVSIEGKVDGIFKDKKTGKYWIVDWKHVANFKPEIEVRLEMDEQINMYFALLWLNGYDVAGFKYIERIKAKFGPPKKFSKKYQGRWFSTSKEQCTSYDLAKFVFETEDKEAYDKGVYDDYLAYLTRVEPELTRITTLRRDENTIQRYIEELRDVIYEMESNETTIYGANGYVCQFCTFKQACNELVRGGDVAAMLAQTTETKIPYYEREF